MPAVRRSQRTEQRLSDFFPSIDALSPIAPKTRSAKVSPARPTSTPATRRKPARKDRKKKEDIQSTPVFDPDLSFSEAEADTSAEEEFIKSIKSSPCKTAAQTPVQTATPVSRGHVKDYEVMVDYNSDSDGFAFSPVKFTPGSVQKRVSRKIKGTPMPAARTEDVAKMVWNSATKKVEERVSRVYIPSPLKRPISSASESSRVTTEVVSEEEGRSESKTESATLTGSDSDNHGEDEKLSELRDAAHSRRTRKSKQAPEIVTPADTHDSESDLIQSQAGEAFEIQGYRAPGPRAATSPVKSSPTTNDLTRLDKSQVDNRISFGSVRASSTMPSQNLTRQRARLSTAITETSTRSPPVRLTRAVSGSLPLQSLETIALPDYVLADSPNRARQKRKMKPYARLPKKIPVTIPKPFKLSTGKSKEDPIEPESIPEKENRPRVHGIARETKDDHDDEPKRSVATKRKASDMYQDGSDAQSPAKRARITADEIRPIAPIRATGLKSRPRTTLSAPFDLSSETGLRQRAQKREARLRQQIEDEARNRRRPDAGRVPRTLYSPEKQVLLRNATPTKPQPFTFSTDARAARSPAVKTPVIVKPLKHLDHRVRVPALELAPFVPKPSSLPITVAASPARQLPHRLETRREFDKVAERHAEEVVQRKRREEELLAAERERKIEERKGWKSQGMAAIENWAAARAAAAKLTSDGKRDWVD